MGPEICCIPTTLAMFHFGVEYTTTHIITKRVPETGLTQSRGKEKCFMPMITP